MELTERQLAILNHVLEDGQAWADNAQQETHVLAKIVKYESAYDEAVAKGSYENRTQREASEEAAREQAKKDKYDNAPWDAKRRVAYQKLNQFEMQFDDQRDSTTTWVDAVNAIKSQFPTPHAGPSALEVWKQDMVASDALLPRWAEDLYDGLALETRDGISAVTKNKIVQKKAKRELRPS